MKKWSIRLLSVVLSLALFCTGCTGQSESLSSTVSSSEQTVNKPLSMDSNGLYHYEVEEIWSRKNIPEEESEYAPMMHRTADGKILLLLTNWEDGAAQFDLFRLENGKAEQVFRFPIKNIIMKTGAAGMSRIKLFMTMERIRLI